MKNKQINKQTNSEQNNKEEHQHHHHINQTRQEKKRKENERKVGRKITPIITSLTLMKNLPQYFTDLQRSPDNKPNLTWATDE